VVVQKGNKASKLLTFLVDTLRSIHGPIECMSFPIATSIEDDGVATQPGNLIDTTELGEQALRHRRHQRVSPLTGKTRRRT
jgi:hypothetical protein